MNKQVICATDGCETEFVRRCNRHKYCDECRKARKKDYWKEWYATVGRTYCREKYIKNREEILAKAKTPENRKRAREYQRKSEIKERHRKRDAELLQLKRERRVREAENGGRVFRRRDAPINGGHMQGSAAYGSARHDNGADKTGDE